MKYNTKQKELIYESIKNINKDFTAIDIYNIINKSVGLTTIYRYLNELVSSNHLQNFFENNITKYHYLNHCDKINHFYLKCNICGMLIHVDCDCINDFEKHILKNHNFYIKEDNIILNGTCNKCYKSLEGKMNNEKHI